MGQPEDAVVQQDQPKIDRDIARMGQLADNVALGEKTVLDRFDRAIAREVGMEINGAVFGEIDFAVLSLGAEEFSGVIAARDGEYCDPARS